MLQRNETGNSCAETHLADQPKEKALLTRSLFSFGALILYFQQIEEELMQIAAPVKPI